VKYLKNYIYDIINFKMAVLNDLIIALYLVFGGCCFNVITLESILTVQKKCGRLITLIQFIFIASEGLIRNITFHNPIKEKNFQYHLNQEKLLYINGW